MDLHPEKFLQKAFSRPPLHGLKNAPLICSHFRRNGPERLLAQKTAAARCATNTVLLSRMPSARTLGPRDRIAWTNGFSKNGGLPCRSECQLTTFQMRTESIRRGLGLASALLLFSLALLHGDDPTKAPETVALPLIKPAVPTDTGLLLQPPLDLSHFSTEEFLALSSTVGLDPPS